MTKSEKENFLKLSELCRAPEKTVFVLASKRYDCLRKAARNLFQNHKIDVETGNQCSPYLARWQYFIRSDKNEILQPIKRNKQLRLRNYLQRIVRRSALRRKPKITVLKGSNYDTSKPNCRFKHIFLYTLFYKRNGRQKNLRRFYNEERNRNVCRKGSKTT